MENASKKPERAILIGAITPGLSESHVNEYLDELALLADTAGAVVVKSFTQKLNSADSATFIGKGKVEQIAGFVKENRIDIAVFDEELAGSQIRNIEAIFKCNVIDRTDLILDIFAKRAKTAHAKIQVELAQYEYLLPRLAGLWTHLERQKGGIGLRGPGEREIETDRRVIRKKISILKEKLKQIDRQKSTQRQNRGKLVRVSLVGYTNAGKSTLMNTLSKENVFAEDKLFATLDTTVRKVVLKNLPVLLCDTVGFIRKLPHHLVESFKSTLDEVRESDILLHVVDVSTPNYYGQMNIVAQTLSDIGAGDKQVIIVFNKTDRLQNQPSKENEEEIISLNAQINSIKEKTVLPSVFISAVQKTNLDELRTLLYESAKAIHIKRWPYNDFVYNTYGL